MISSRVVLLATLVAHALCREPFVQLEEDIVLQVERVEFHAYENAWSVGFSHAPDVHAFDVLVFEVCRPPCEDGGDGGGEALVYPCAALARGFAQRGWRNEYMWARANESRELCADLHAAASGSSVLQGQATLVLSDAEGLPLVRVRAPLTLVLYNDDELARWASGKGADLLSVAVRVSYITALQSEFAMRRSVLRIELRRPVRSVLSFSVQNPCTALGLSAPESGHVMLVNVSGRPQCAWFCRGDMIKKPYNSAPPTRAQGERLDAGICSAGAQVRVPPTTRGVDGNRVRFDAGDADGGRRVGAVLLRPSGPRGCRGAAEAAGRRRGRGASATSTTRCHLPSGCGGCRTPNASRKTARAAS